MNNIRKIFKKRKRRKPNNIQTKVTQEEQEPDEVYIITSKIYNINGKQLYKIGRSKDYWGSRKKNYDSDTALPVPIETLMVFHSDTHRYLENHLLNKYNHLKCNEHPHRREFFYLSLEDLLEIYLLKDTFKGYSLSYVDEEYLTKFKCTPRQKCAIFAVKKGFFDTVEDYEEYSDALDDWTADCDNLPENIDNFICAMGGDEKIIEWIMTNEYDCPFYLEGFMDMAHIHLYPEYYVRYKKWMNNDCI